MIKLLVIASAVTVAGISAAGAMPAAKNLSSESDVITVAGGCGAGWHRGPYGVCHRNGAYYYYRPYAYVPPPPPPPPRCVWVDRGHGPVRVCAW